MKGYKYGNWLYKKIQGGDLIDKFLLSTDKKITFLFYYLIILFFIIPEPIQHPFRIFLGGLLLVYFIFYLHQKNYNRFDLWKLVILFIIVVLIILNGGYQTAVPKMFLSSLGLLVIKDVSFSFYKTKLFKIIYYVAMLSIVLQMIYAPTFADGRHKLFYELNLSGTFLFLFFLLSEVTQIKWGRYLVLILSFFIISRTLFFSLLIFYILKYMQNFIPRFFLKLHFSVYYLLATLFLVVFSFCYFEIVEYKWSEYRGDIKRVYMLNDSGNRLRFSINKIIVKNIFIDHDKKLIFGYGKMLPDTKLLSQDGGQISPHSEFFTSIAEFGYVFTLYMMFITLPIFNKYFHRENFLILFPLLFITLFLWVSYFLAPTYEMLFIILLLKINSNRFNLTTNNKSHDSKKNNKFGGSIQK